MGKISPRHLTKEDVQVAYEEMLNIRYHDGIANKIWNISSFIQIFDIFPQYFVVFFR